MNLRSALLSGGLMVLAACSRSPSVDAPTTAAASIIDNTALSLEQDGRNWAAYGRTFSEGHYSPLDQVNTQTVQRLGLAWTLDLDVNNSITTPLAVDGVIYLGAGHGVIHAIDARSGRLLWRHDAMAMQANREKLRTAWGIRGIAFWKGRVYAGTSDGRLIALDARDGREVWSALTVDPKDGATITGAPRVFNGKVIIGFSGGDFSALRGYVTAYDAASGAKLWRFYVVPPKPQQRDGEVSDEMLPVASRTWTGQWWKYGGGGAVWNAITYDPDFNRIYIGTGNGTPMNGRIRSPGGGDNLFVASVVALDADTGRYVWHYQTTPGDPWDFDSATDMTLAQLTLDGQSRKVLLHAAKNGFVYAFDRAAGRLLSAEKLGNVIWADGIDLATGRPVPVGGGSTFRLKPGFQSAHHWPPQSFSPATGYLYVPTIEMPMPFDDGGARHDNYAPRMRTTDYTGFPVAGTPGLPRDAGRSVLRAWDPVARRVVWSVETAGISNGGTLATAGGLVFEGLADGHFHAYDARDGRDLWSFHAGVAATGVPISFSVDGQQYVIVTAGPPGGSTAAFGPISSRWGWDSRLHPRRLLAFRLDGTAKLPATPPPRPAVPLQGEGFVVDARKVKQGEFEYEQCTLCHGMGIMSGGIAPDLRASPVLLSFESLSHVVREGSLAARGMPPFPELTDAQLEAIQHYVRQKARADLRSSSD